MIRRKLSVGACSFSTNPLDVCHFALATELFYFVDERTPGWVEVSGEA